jgi:hypothetical protein
VSRALTPGTDGPDHTRSGRGVRAAASSTVLIHAPEAAPECPCAQAEPGLQRFSRSPLCYQGWIEAMSANTVPPPSQFQGPQRAFCADVWGVRATHQSCDGSKKRGAHNPEHRNNETSIEIIVAHLARCFGDEGATMTSGAMKPALFHARSWGVVRTDRVVGAKRSHSER